MELKPLELEEFEEEFQKSDYESMDIFLAEKVNQQQEEIKQLKAFFDYFSELHGKDLEVANWHMNGDLEPFDNFFDSAKEEMS